MSSTEQRQAKVVSFLNDIVELARKYEVSLSHEDTHGNFVVLPWSQELEEWLLDATDGTDHE